MAQMTRSVERCF